MFVVSVVDLEQQVGQYQNKTSVRMGIDLGRLGESIRDLDAEVIYRLVVFLEHDGLSSGLVIPTRSCCVEAI